MADQIFIIARRYSIENWYDVVDMEGMATDRKTAEDIKAKAEEHYTDEDDPTHNPGAFVIIPMTPADDAEEWSPESSLWHLITQ